MLLLVVAGPVARVGFVPETEGVGAAVNGRCSVVIGVVVIGVDVDEDCGASL